MFIWFFITFASIHDVPSLTNLGAPVFLSDVWEKKRKVSMVGLHSRDFMSIVEIACYWRVIGLGFAEKRNIASWYAYKSICPINWIQNGRLTLKNRRHIRPQFAENNWNHTPQEKQLELF